MVNSDPLVWGTPRTIPWAELPLPSSLRLGRARFSPTLTHQNFFFLRSYFKLKLFNLIKVNFTCGNMVKSRTGPFSFQCIRRHRNIIALSWSKSCYNRPCHVRTASDYTACIKWYWINGAFPEVNSIALKSSIVKALRERIPRNLELRCCYLREHYIVRCTTRN